MSLSAKAAISILETRYDYYSARSVLKEAAAQAGADAGGPFDAGALADALLVVGERCDVVAEALRNAGGGKPAKAKAKAAPAPAAEEAPAEEAAPAEKPASKRRRKKGGGGGEPAAEPDPAPEAADE